ncbi:hypothetical protein L2E82_51157 [Cichorium intybus]|nr:hypothetical protein L2E82_51157 [Cichorium intybus]
MSSSSAARTVNSWCGFTSMLPLLVAPLVDSYGNSYSTVLASSFLYLVAFGADQIDTEDELPMAKSDDKKPDKKSMFFQWWYFGVCSSSLFGMSIMPNIQDSVGWGLGFAMPAMAMAVSIVMFSCGSRFYAYIHDQSNDVKSLEKVVQAVKCSVSKFVHSKTEEKSSLAKLEVHYYEKRTTGESWDMLAGSPSCTLVQELYCHSSSSMAANGKSEVH